MGALLDKINLLHPLVWLDDLSYVERLLGGGRIDWLDVAGLVALRRKAAGLLRAELTVLPAAAVAAAWIEAQPELRQAMASKPRPVVPLRTLLADPGLRARLDELIRALRAGLPGRPLVLALPSPRRWLAEAYSAAHGAGAVLSAGAEEIDTAAVYVAEFLRSFGESGLDAVLLQEALGAEPASAAEISWYRPVLNIAGHYRWDLGLQLPDASGFAGPARDLDFIIAPQPLSGCTLGVALDGEFWSGAAPPQVPAGGFLFAVVPTNAVPEQVLARLAVLRGGAD
ncbi:hypothetical protein [Nevskia soli]|uniref:hypothetical protein n=1 Tax=Nevskia soli TaxID=418856 RepID=UPI00055FF35C|nr:hypothetical protein [Nevskia soli]